jgi:hypothetical protein
MPDFKIPVDTQCILNPEIMDLIILSKKEASNAGLFQKQE